MPTRTICLTPSVLWPRLVLGLLGLCWASGCGPRPAETSPVEVERVAKQHVAEQLAEPSAGVTPPSTPSPPSPAPRQLLAESWELVLVGGAKVGYGHQTAYASHEGEQAVIEYTSTNELSMQRFGQNVSQQIEATSVETPEGQVVRFGTMLRTGPSELTIQGHYADGQLIIETGTLGKTKGAEIAWDRDWGGFFADQQSLRQQPMQPGERRALRALIPATAQAGDIELVAQQRESTKLLTEERELLRIESLVRIADTSIRSVMWTDDQGEVLKTTVPGLNHETYRTTKEIALGPVDAAEFDLGTQSVVEVPRPLSNAHATQRVVYRARLAHGDPRKTFAAGPSQRLTRLDDRTAEITVIALRPGTAATDQAAHIPPTPADLAPNNMIQSDDPAIVQLARQVAGDAQDPWTIATTFEKFVGQYVQTKSFSQAMSSAADVVRSREGDCTEHAVLLAALCRAQGIPARVAIGLVYYSPVQGFAYHMWNEVWVGDMWIPIDATLGLGGIGAAHLKIVDSDLGSASPVTALLPVIEVIGQLELDIVSVE